MISRTRVAGLFAAAATIGAVAFAAYRSCAEFSNTPGFDLCRPMGVSALLPFLIVAWIPSFFITTAPRAGSVVLWLVYALHVISAIVVAPFYVGPSSVSFLVSLGIAVLYSLAAHRMWACVVGLRRYRMKESTFVWALGGVAGLAALAIQHQFPLQGGLPSLVDVYTRRAEFENALQDSGSGKIIYVILMSSFSIAPLCYVLGVGCLRRRWLGRGIGLFALGCALTILVFNAAAYKSVALLPWAVLAAMLVLKRQEGRELPAFLVALAMIVLGLCVLGMFESGHFIFLQLFRRVFVTPGMNAAFFFRHFGVTAIPGVRDAPLTISQIYYGTAGSANTGVLGDGLARGGLIGIVLDVALLSMYARFIDTASKRLPLYVTAAVFIPQAYALANSGTLTVLGSYGLPTTLLGVYLMSGTSRRMWRPKSAGPRPGGGRAVMTGAVAA